MASFQGKLFYLWLFILPFGYQFTGYTGITEPDKIVGLLLLAIGVLSFIGRPPQRQQEILFLMFLAVLLLIIKTLSVLGSSLYLSQIWVDSNKIAYFIIPLLYLNSLDRVYKAGWLVVFMAVAGCLSAFMVSMEFIKLPISVPLEYRISWLPRAKGLFLSTGNLAQYIAFAIAWVVVAPGVEDKNSKLLRYTRIGFFIALSLGLLATQSRNVFLVIVVTLAGLWYLRYSKTATGSIKTLVTVVLLVGGLVTFLVVAVFYGGDVVNTVAGAGGDYAQASAFSRLKQYSIAWEVIRASPLLGANPDAYRQYGEIINHIHNMWLQLFANGGAISVIIMLIILVKVYQRIRRDSWNVAKSDIVMVANVYFLGMLVSVMFYIGMDKMYWVLLGIAAAIAQISVKAPEYVKDKSEGKVLVGEKFPSVRLKSR